MVSSESFLRFVHILSKTKWDIFLIQLKKKVFFYPLVCGFLHSVCVGLRLKRDFYYAISHFTVREHKTDYQKSKFIFYFKNATTPPK